MTVPIRLNVRSDGHGPAVVCVHASGSAGSQWQPLADRIASRFCCVSVDLIHHGASPPVCDLADYRLADDGNALAQVLAELAEPVHLVGHSYGAAVALDVARRFAHRVRALTLYEPVLFALLEPGSALLQEVSVLGHSLIESIAAGDHDAAAQRFIDYWGGPGAWARMPDKVRAAQVRRIAIVARHFVALLDDPVPAAALRQLPHPVLLLGGQCTTQPALAISAALAGLLPAVNWALVPNASHMGPITHSDRVNALIVDHLELQRSLPGTWARAA